MAIGASVGSAVLGAGASIYSSNQAASAQKKAAQKASDTQMQMFNTTQNNLQPYMGAGASAQSTLTNELPNLAAPVVMDQAALQRTPGYQFNRAQGLRAVQNGYAARGLGSSGAALKGAANYATGLADSTYQNQFNNAVTNQTNKYNRLLGVASLGENAAAGLGNNAVTTGANIGNNIVGAGNGQAAAYLQGGQAIGNAANSVPNSLLTQQLIGGIYGNNAGGGASAGGPGVFDQEAFSSGLPWSDIRLKENIISIGSENGFPIYSFNYKWHPQTYIGVMAQDILKLLPEAVRKIGEYFAVDYEKLGVTFRRA
jgi:hypothetical protein